MVAPTDCRAEPSLVSIGLEDGLEFLVDLVKRMHQAGFEMLRQGTTVAASDDLGGAGVGESVLVRTRAAQCVVNVDQMDQARRFGNETAAQTERISAAVPIFVMS